MIMEITRTFIGYEDFDLVILIIFEHLYMFLNMAFKGDSWINCCDWQYQFYKYYIVFPETISSEMLAIVVCCTIIKDKTI